VNIRPTPPPVQCCPLVGRFEYTPRCQIRADPVESLWVYTLFSIVAYSWPLCANMTSSTNPEVHNVSQRRHRRIEPYSHIQHAHEICWSSDQWFQRYARGQTRIDTIWQTDARRQLIAILRSSTAAGGRVITHIIDAATAADVRSGTDHDSMIRRRWYLTIGSTSGDTLHDFLPVSNVVEPKIGQRVVRCFIYANMLQKNGKATRYKCSSDLLKYPGVTTNCGLFLSFCVTVCGIGLSGETRLNTRQWVTGLARPELTIYYKNIVS